MRLLKRLPLLAWLALLLIFVTTGCAQLDSAYWKLASQQRDEALALARQAYTKAEQAALAAQLSPQEARSVALGAAREEVTEYIGGRGREELMAHVKGLLPGLVSDVGSGDWLGAGTGGGAILLNLLLWWWAKGRDKKLAAALMAQLDPHTAAIALDDVSAAARLPAMGAPRAGPPTPPTVPAVAAPATVAPAGPMGPPTG